MITTKEILKKCDQILPKGIDLERNAFVQGYLAAYNDLSNESGDYYQKIASCLKGLWPSGEKKIVNRNGTVSSYPWQESVNNLVKRLEFLWKDRGFKKMNYTVDDCAQAAKRYLADFEKNTTYMQTLKYFVFRQEKTVSPTDGKVTYTYKSSFADYLESNPKEDLLFNEGDLV